MASPIAEAKRLLNSDGQSQAITIGEVVDTNDPQQMGRIRVACALFGELEGSAIETIPWAIYMSPFAGTTVAPSRGRSDDKTPGEVAYGMFNIPKVGSRVLIAMIDGDPRFRVWLGCLFDQYMTHTLPHGRYSYNTVEKPDGPFSSTEDKIQPLYDSQTSAFTNTSTGVDPRKSFEYRTRGADTQVAGLDDEIVDSTFLSFLADDFAVEYTEEDGKPLTNTQGYKKSRIEADASASNTKDDILYDPQTYSWTSPGFHSMAMSDDAENCRIRFRTTHGHQIIMDDTNERIYVSTAGGKAWIELDEAGNIDVYAERNLSFHAKKDINFTTDKAFRVSAKEGIHLESDTELRLHAKQEMHIKSATDMYIHTDATLYLHSGTDSKFEVGGDMSVTSTNVFVETIAAVDITAGAAFIVDAGVTASLLAAGNVLLTGAQVHLNGPPASPGAGADTTPPTAAKESFLTSRVPDHEPWARTMTKAASADGDAGNTSEPDLTYTSVDVGKKERSETISRNPKWHR